jgi:predicted RNA-binding Zn-ribbon protein involved in translation (DUF1610 family)
MPIIACAAAAAAGIAGQNLACGRARIVAAVLPTNPDAHPFALYSRRSAGKEHQVTDQLVCPRCGKVGLVRVEHVIRGHHATRSYDCGACEHTWTLPEPPPAPAKPSARWWNPKTHRIGPKRRRPLER